MKALLAIVTLAFICPAYGQEDGYHLDKDYPMQPNGILRLNLSDAKVFVTGSNRANAHVKIDRVVTTKGLTFGHDYFSIDIAEENGGLNIREHSGSSTMGIVGYYSEKYEVTIALPKGAGVRIKGDDGDYHLTYLDGEIVVDLDDGDVEVLGCGGNNFEFTLDDGDVKMDQGKGSLLIKADDADVRISNGAFTSIDVETDDGDFIVETSLADLGDYRIRTQDGLVSMKITGGGGDFVIRHDDTRVVTEGNFREVEKSDDRTKLSLSGGKANVDIRSNDGRVRLAAR